jgi:hypothetical protein
MLEILGRWTQWCKMITEPIRDFIGYGGNPPDPKWPNDARLALNFVMNFEEGSEPSFAEAMVLPKRHSLKLARRG